MMSHAISSDCLASSSSRWMGNEILKWKSAYLHDRLAMYRLFYHGPMWLIHAGYKLDSFSPHSTFSGQPGRKTEDELIGRTIV